MNITDLATKEDLQGTKAALLELHCDIKRWTLATVLVIVGSGIAITAIILLGIFTTWGQT